jgi:hypothetical protein
MSGKNTDAGEKDRSFKIAIYVVAAVEAVGLAAFILSRVLL